MQTRQPSTVHRRPRRYRWTRVQYEQMIEAGVFGEDDRVELIHGYILPMSPQRSQHATGVRLVRAALDAAYGGRSYVVDVQLPLAFGQASEPEPDVAVIPGTPRDYADAHPQRALLVVEVADTSLRRDRTVKARLYAEHGVDEYWILNLNDAQLEVHRDPSGDTYGTKQTLRAGDTVRPPETDVPVAVADLLP